MSLFGEHCCDGLCQKSSLTLGWQLEINGLCARVEWRVCLLCSDSLILSSCSAVQSCLLHQGMLHIAIQQLQAMVCTWLLSVPILQIDGRL